MSKKHETEPEQTEVTDVSDAAIAEAFEIDTGKTGRAKSSINIEKFRALIETAIRKMEELGSNGVKLPMTQINQALGTRFKNNNSLAYRLKTGKETKPILEEHNLYVGGRGLWNGDISQQKIAFVKK
jgi:hypothetical protein